jgi:hypothetical protein
VFIMSPGTKHVHVLYMQVQDAPDTAQKLRLYQAEADFQRGPEHDSCHLADWFDTFKCKLL